MIVKLRKRHLYTWVVIALALPLGIILAFTNVHEVEKDELATSVAEPLGEVVSNGQGEHVLINLRKKANQYQIEAVVLKPIQAANTMLQIAQGGNIITLGRLASTGVYRFSIPQNVSIGNELELTIYDQIKKTEIEKITVAL